MLAITGPQQYESVLDAVHRAVPPQHDPFLDLVPPEGIKLTPRHYAYLKISEGCNNRCTFCIIPKLRGDLVSRPAADVLREAERLVAAGVKELLVISQDTSAYGVDIKYAPSAWKDREVRAKFLDLARELGTLGAWVRLHYVYPYPHVDEVIPLMADGESGVLPYLDIPFQHASPDVLKRMKRPAAQEKTLGRIARWREICPDLTLRSTFIVGFPGETDQDFELLLDWLDEAALDRVGCFRYEPVRGAVVERSRRRRCRRRRRRTAGTASCSASRRSRRGASSARSAPASRSSSTRSARPSPRAAPKGDAPEIDGAVYVGEPPAAARRRDRDGEDRARRRIRPARHRGRVLAISPKLSAVVPGTPRSAGSNPYLSWLWIRACAYAAPE